MGVVNSYSVILQHFRINVGIKKTDEVPNITIDDNIWRHYHLSQRYFLQLDIRNELQNLGKDAYLTIANILTFYR